MLRADQIQRVLVIMAHPDDVDFGCAGTVAQFTANGVEVSYAIATNGDAGGFDEAVARSRIPGIRQGEQRAAAKEVGVGDVVFLGFPDGRLVASQELRRDLSREIRRVRPQLVICQSPEFHYKRMPASHPDHRAAGEAALCAVYPDARNPFAHPAVLADEGLAAHTVPEIWIVGAPNIDHYVDVTDTFDRKLAALQAHVSQTAHLPDLEGLLRGWLGLQATEAGLAEGRLAEAYQLVEIPF